MISSLDFDSAMRSPVLPDLKNEIHLVRGERVMLDFALAQIYGVQTRRLNEQLRRNHKKFPSDFAFQLTLGEFTNLMSQIATSSSNAPASKQRSQNVTSSLHGGRRKLPWVFTEHGAIMLATVLNSDIAVDAIAQLFQAIRSLIERPPLKRREIGFHVREKSGAYRAKKKL